MIMTSGKDMIQNSAISCTCIKQHHFFGIIECWWNSSRK